MKLKPQGYEYSVNKNEIFRGEKGEDALKKASMWLFLPDIKLNFAMAYSDIAYSNMHNSSGKYMKLACLGLISGYFAVYVKIEVYSSRPHLWFCTILCRYRNPLPSLPFTVEIIIL